MASFGNRSHGVILNIAEILSQDTARLASTVRVLGKLISYDVPTNIAVIEHGGERLLVDVTLLGDFPHRLKSLLQFIGELEDHAPHAGGGSVVLRARIVRNVDGLDLKLFEQSLLIRRRFEDERTRLGSMK
ncbi:telomere-capping, CST complex subunit-domain-containing protein [Blyttiomyces helicus]|uniref:Telomere-capping, CST complex subunit-domain-containing protein n=1 Tax=Blyttiomyces helicus TaxID=388810 RepID=A0A4P9WP25_9FUNG|nr:telomere-capping, CST complex subunit-domain-containing protein [Blyttiomyces helicus]|eukprot:RKO93863.1 telomere-capping, CST complex subunit-domain-containing protein [Blyttiomyces helicus]